MSRYIDADKLIEELTNQINDMITGIPDGDYLKGNVKFSVIARDLVKDQPTAFDVDKVVDKLDREVLGKPVSKQFENGIHKAIEIIRQVK